MSELKPRRMSLLAGAQRFRAVFYCVWTPTLLLKGQFLPNNIIKIKTIETYTIIIKIACK
jgi:hypothetical protein